MGYFPSVYPFYIRCSEAHQYFFDVPQRPIEFFFLHHERRREADHILVRLFAQQAAFLQSFAIAAGAAGFGFQFNADE